MLASCDNKTAISNLRVALFICHALFTTYAIHRESRRRSGGGELQDWYVHRHMVFPGSTYHQTPAYVPRSALYASKHRAGQVLVATVELDMTQLRCIKQAAAPVAFLQACNWRCKRRSLPSALRAPNTDDTCNADASSKTPSSKAGRNHAVVWQFMHLQTT